MKSLLLQLGFLRSALLVLVIIMLILAPEPYAQTQLEWPQVVPTLIIPALVPLIFMVVLLDLMMAKIMSSGTDDISEKKRYRRIMLINVLAAGSILWVCLPFYLALGR